jgi:hypothetical protein
MNTSTESWLEIFGEGGLPVPEDLADLPILSSLVGSMRAQGTAPSVDNSWNEPDPTGGVAPRPLPLESLQSLPVASRML